MYMIETHLHTSEVSGCGQVRAADMIKRYKAASYDTVFVTDHFQSSSLDPMGDISWEDKITIFFSGYYRAKAMGDKLGVTVNELITDPNALPENGGKVEQTMGKVVEKALKRKANKNIILGLSSILTWFVALLIYVILSSADVPNSWLAFFYALPADCIVMLSLRSAWKDFRWNRILISGIMWGALIALYTTLFVLANINVWRIFLLGIPGQAAILLWFRMFRPMRKDEENENGQEGSA